MNFSVFKRKKVYIPLMIAVLVIGLPAYGKYKASKAPIEYETVKVVRGDIKQSVDAVGKVTSVDDLALHFEVPGTVGTVSVSEGQSVKEGTVLATLRLAELNAAVAQAEANLNQKLAGPTTQDRAYYDAAVVSAKASFEQSKIDAANTISAAESAVATAKNNLKLSEGGSSSQIVAQAYENAVTTLQSLLPKLDDGLTQADNILGIDNSGANQDFEAQLSVLAVEKLPRANDMYDTAKLSRNAARTAITLLSVRSPQAAIDAGLSLAEKALADMNALLVGVSDVLNASVTGGSLTQTLLDTKKTTIDTTRSVIATQYATVIGEKQDVLNAKNSATTYTIAYDKAVRDLEQTKANAESSVKIKESAYLQAQSNFEAKVNPPREVDIASYRAALAQAVATRNKAMITAPIDGVVTKIEKKPGEQISSSEVMVKLLSPHYEVNVDVSETDIPKITVGDAVVITLDAYGSDTKFSGQVSSIDPGATEIQDVVYYQVKIRLDDSEKEMKPGMTANVVIGTDDRVGTLYVPFRAVRVKDGERFVEVLENGTKKEQPVTLGLRADNGLVEITEGLSEGADVITGTKEK